MKQNRREFMTGAAWMGAAALSAGCISKGSGFAGLGRGAGAPMHGFRVAPMKKVRVGVIGVGSRGTGAVRRIAQIPGCEVTAMSDINPKRLDENQAWLKERGYKAPKEWSRNGDEEEWKGLCDSDVCDVVYSVTPRPLHAPINVYALDHGKHVFQEVPGAFNLEECWATVEAAERNRRHCMMLENCTYGEEEMLAFNLIHKGKLGEIVQAEVGYQHDQRSLQYKPRDGRFWRIDRHLHHHGNYYPTHGLVPAGRCLDINRGDRFEYLVSMETKSASFEQFGRDHFPASDWRHSAKMVKGDINMSMLRTAMGRIVTLIHNVCTPRPYDRGNLYMGTNGIFRSYPSLLMAWEEKTGDNGAHQYFPADKALKIKEEYRHPFWKVAGEIAKKVGGHGGMDFVMDLRWAYCLQNGLPLDTDVYDLATYSSIVELTEKSVNARSAAIDFPDYTRGGWKAAKPFTVDEIDIGKFDFGAGVLKG
ncbi:MAG: Gfo/Idh/MocA family oxidoreductase [Kiritimatiellae bacterium]|nr:Gfo/Idh/MocA family oxidoreductase [Kiritimatiellia bacterium]